MTIATRVPTQPGLEKSVCSLSVIFARHWALKKLLAESGDQSVSTKFRIACRSCFAPLLLLCLCFAYCCHDAFIVRSASIFSTFPRFHSASVSMFTINIDNCLFLLLFLVSPSLQPWRHIHHRLTSGLSWSVSGLQFFSPDPSETSSAFTL